MSYVAFPASVLPVIFAALIHCNNAAISGFSLSVPPASPASGILALFLGQLGGFVIRPALRRYPRPMKRNRTRLVRHPASAHTVLDRARNHRVSPRFREG